MFGLQPQLTGLRFAARMLAFDIIQIFVRHKMFFSGKLGIKNGEVTFEMNQLARSMSRVISISPAAISKSPTRK